MVRHNMEAATSHLLMGEWRIIVLKDIRRREKEAYGHPKEESGENDDVAQLSADIARINLGIYIKRKSDEEDRPEQVGVYVH